MCSGPAPVTECTQVSDQGHGIIRASGIHRADQIGGWKNVADAVHAAGGPIFLQIWHCGPWRIPYQARQDRAAGV
jgi:2,4-dienoyl-CoA reductase-like NADH-dependent reductase (Old Yellow Enzyme family)